jgi:hypothetical protein
LTDIEDRRKQSELNPAKIGSMQVPVLCAATLLVALATAPAATITVSTDGPVKTLAAARDKVRELRNAGDKSPMTVVVRAGTYFLDEPLVLTPEDSGVTYTASPGARAIISGGKRITGWKLEKAPYTWTTSADYDFHQLFVAGRRAIRARSPGQGYFRVDGRVQKQQPLTFKYRGDSIKKSWAERGDVEVQVLCSWQEARGRITAVDEAAHTVQLAASAPRPAVTGHADCYYSVDNVPDAGMIWAKWYLDRKNGTLRYFDRVDPSHEEVIAPLLERLVILKGEPENGKLVRNVVFRGLDFRHTDWKLAENGFSGMQSVSTVSAAFEAEGAEGVTIEHCMFTQLGNYAISFGRGCYRNRVIGNDIYDIGAGGVKIGEATMNRQRENEAERSGFNVVSDNDIHQLGRVYPAAAGVLVGQSSDNTVSHNHIHDLYHNAISVGWTWQYKLVSLKNNMIEYNHIHDIGHGVMSDMGGIYTLGEQPGTVLRNNVIHDINALVYGGWGIYLDQATTGLVAEKNIVYNCSVSGFNQHFGRENIVRNNIFAFNKEYQATRDLAEKHLSFTMERNIVYFDEGHLLGANWNGGYKMDHNVYWDTSGRAIRPAGMSWKEWQASGMDAGSVVADPLFINAANFDFRLKPGSPALRLGFQQIDVTTVGPRGVAGPAGRSK